MLSHIVRGREGQTLVLVAIFLVALLAFLALAIDVGLIYAERRRMQNAADAGALAGAREYCFGDPFGDTGAAVASAELYAENNGAETVDVLIEEDEAVVVDVTAQKVANLYFARIFGRDTTDVGANAAAVCGGATSACGLWPVAFAKDIWVQDDMCPTPETCNCGRIFYVWSGDQEQNAPDCSVEDCDVTGPDGLPDGLDDVVGMFGRAWLDFSEQVTDENPDSCEQSGCGTSEMVCWLEGDSGAQIDLGDPDDPDRGVCIDGNPGTRAAAQKPVDSRIGDPVSIPLFDYIDCGGEDCTGNSVHVTDFGCVTVLGWEHHVTLWRTDGGHPASRDIKAIKVALCGDCKTFCGGARGGPITPSGVRAVSLIR